MKKGINSIDIMVPSFLTLHYLSQKSSHSFLRGKEKKYMKKKKKKKWKRISFWKMHLIFDKLKHQFITK